MEKVNCNFCNSTEYKFITKQTDLIYKTTNDFFNVVECCKCGLNYTNPRPSENEINNFYKPNYQFHKQNNKFKAILRGLIKLLANSNFGFVFSYVPMFCNKLKYYIQKNVNNPLSIKKDDFFLDIGAGSFDTSYLWDFKGSLKYYKKKTKNIYAVEPGIESLDNIKKNGIMGFKKIEEVPRNINFDFIRMNWSLEHTHDPKKFFSFFKDRLKDNGKIILSIPNYNGLIYLLDKSQVEVPIHLFHFKENDIKNYCQIFNLKIISFETFSLASMFYAVGKYNKNFESFSKMSLGDLKRFQNILNKLDNFKLGGDMIFTIKKN